MSVDTSKVATSNRTNAATASKPGKGASLATWADDRLGLATAMKKNLRKVFPDHWSFMLGEIALWSFVVLLRDLAPGNALDVGKLAHTIWEPQMRLVRDVVGTPILATEIEVGDLINAAPEAMFPTEENGYPELHGAEEQAEKAKGAIIIVRMDPDDITAGKGREKWTVDGIICYSKICTHVGCPISLYERTTHHVLCPCHQSTFDLADHARVVFGPAARPLPQLPLAVDDEGYLVAQSDFNEPIGASFWEREKL